MNRRFALRLSVGAAAALLLGGHTPYGQWVVYRKKHLLIGCHKEDAETYRLAKSIVAAFETSPPESFAASMPARRSTLKTELSMS